MSCNNGTAQEDRKSLPKKRKIDRAPLVLRMPSCIKSGFRAHANADIHVHTRTDVRAVMRANALTPDNVRACKQEALHAAIVNKRIQILLVCALLLNQNSLFKEPIQQYPTLCRCVTFSPHVPLPRSLSCA